MTPISHTWEPISDLPADYQSLVNHRFNEVAERWIKIRPLIDNDILLNILEKIKTEWVVELGNVENIYYIDDKTIETLIKDGLYSIQLPLQGNSALVIDPQAFFYSHADVYDAIYDMVISSENLNKFVLRGMHALLTENQFTSTVIDSFGKRINVPLSKGIFKRWPNNPRTTNGAIHQYCPPEQVESELTRLLDFHAEHLRNRVPAEIEAAWLHHRFIQIHPFQDGNARVARVLAALCYIKAGTFPPTVKLNDINSYLDAIKLANNGNLKPLIDYFANLVANKTEYYMKSVELPSKI
jgi:hypothetical protein